MNETLSYPLSLEETRQIWNQACLDIQPKVSNAVYSTWVLNNPVTAIELLGDTKAVCTITSPTAFHSTNLKKNLGSLLEQTMTTLLGREVELAFTIGTPSILQNQKKPTPTNPLTSPSAPEYQSSPTAPLSQPPTQSQTSPTTPSSQFSQPLSQSTAPSHFQSSPRVEDLFSESTIRSATIDRVKVTARQAGLRADYVFDTFAVSTTNEMAHAAATAVSQRPGTAYNPLFLYGGVGVGKTHLMHAIGHNILQSDPTVKIIYCTGEEFTNEIVEAIQNKKALKFKEKYRTAQVLLIDDIQFIAGKTSVQEEFFHTFNALTQQARQIVLTSDRPPHEINLLEDRLRSRFEAGLMVDIQSPSFELRTAILLIKSRASGLEVPMDIAQLIAAKVDSARKIEGVIKRLKSAIELQHRSLDPSLVEEILKQENGDLPRRLKVTPNDIIKTVANHYHVKQQAIRGKQRVKSLVKARHMAMYLIKEELSLPLVEIGRWFSNRDHTSVLHATRKIEEEVGLNDLTLRDVSALRTSLASLSR